MARTILPPFNPDRRLLLTKGAALGAALALTGPAKAISKLPASPYPNALPYPFTLGVASGEPRSHAVVLWTRLAPAPEVGDGGMPGMDVLVHYEVATDDGFHHIVHQGWTLAPAADAHTIHLDLNGLAPGWSYYYRFHAADYTSPVGRTRTAPAPGAVPDALRFAVTSCQDFEDGLYTAHRHLADETLDLVVFLGDYIYEGAPRPGSNKVRHHTGAGEPVTLPEYRVRYALYKSDPDLQTAHAAHPWVVSFDDHEVDNDWGGDIPQDPDRQSRDAFLARRAAAFQAWWEHQPLRHFQRPHDSGILAFRAIDYGSLARFYVLDTRQYRSLTEPCGYGTGPVCDAVFDPARTMLGTQQERWLMAELAASRTRWNFLAQQVPIARLDVGEPDGEMELKLDKWDAYPVARRRLLEFIGKVRPGNPVVLTGDLHDGWAAHIKPDFDDPTSPVVASEFIGQSMSSDGDSTDESGDGEAVRLNGRNPHVIFHDNHRGYLRCTLSASSLRADFRAVDVVSVPGAAIYTRASFVMVDGNPVAEPD
jgi:alkaline phosphatase D